MADFQQFDSLPPSHISYVAGCADFTNGEAACLSFSDSPEFLMRDIAMSPNWRHCLFHSPNFQPPPTFSEDFMKGFATRRQRLAETCSVQRCNRTVFL
jgi:hypothetical protein